MPEAIPADSVGLITPQSMTFQNMLRQECGTRLPEYTLACETCGKLSGRAAIYRFSRNDDAARPGLSPTP
ncbi:MAG: hypothetical protein WBQ78_17935 [Gammaproteobacteria bacterium]